MFNGRWFDRLCDLGVLARIFHDDAEWSYEIRPFYREALEEIVAQKRTPLSLLAETLLADEHASVSGYAAAFMPREPSAELQARHARMVMHEIRNAVVPVRMALSQMHRTLQASTPEAQWRPLWVRIDGGIERLFRFAGELEQVAKVGSSAPAPFDPGAAIRDAITGLNGGLGLAVQFQNRGDLPQIVGHRARFTLALVNLLRNAAQNSGKASTAVLVGATLAGTRDRVVVTVDDDGPGVPEEHRDAIFLQGFALRHGGSGQGLALVREVVEVEMRGTVRCEQSEAGGARFILEIPLPAKEQP